jgi:hypothetical protein
VLILLLTGISLALPFCSRVSAKTNSYAGEGVPVRAEQAVTQDVPVEISAVGNVETVNSVEVKSRIAGHVEQVAFQEGQTVAKGQLLYTSIEMCWSIRRPNSAPSWREMPPREGRASPRQRLRCSSGSWE